MPRHSTMLALGTEAPKFALPDTVGKTRKLDEFAASPVLLVAFICNHCPYVKHILDGFVQFARTNMPRGVRRSSPSARTMSNRTRKMRRRPWRSLPRIAVLAFRIFSTSPRPSPRRIRPFVHRISFSLIAGGGLFIAANSTAAGQEATAVTGAGPARCNRGRTGKPVRQVQLLEVLAAA